MSSGRAIWLHWLSSRGIMGVLILICAGFSLATIREQQPRGAAAALDVALQLPNGASRVAIVASSAVDDSAFVEELRRQFQANGIVIAEDARGDPLAARRALERLAASPQSIDAIVCSPTAANWLLLKELPSDFPALSSTPIVVARSYWWPSFLRRDNLLNVANQIAVIAIVAIGVTMVIIAGGIDLSVGSLIALSAVASTLLIREVAGGRQASAPGMVLACLASVLLCGLVGGCTGFLVTSLRVPPFIVTLAMMLIASGVALRLTEGESVYELPDTFVWLGRSADLAGVPNAVLLMLLLYLVAHVVMTRMTLGRYLYAVGGNTEAARLAGVPVRAVLVFAYVASGALAGLGGVVMASQLRSGSPNYGNGYELTVIAAAVVGGTSLSGGEGSMFGTLIGAFIIAVIQNGMNLMNVNPFTQKIALGLVILVAVLLDRQRQKLWRAANA